MAKSKYFKENSAKYDQLKDEWQKNNHRKPINGDWRNPYINDADDLYDGVWNYDNVVLFNHRYLERDNTRKKRYRNRSLLFNYCTRVSSGKLQACRLFIALGGVGIIDISDLLEAEEWIVEVNPANIRGAMRYNLYPPSYKPQILEMIDLVKQGISLV